MVISNGVLMKVSESDLVNGEFIVPNEVKIIGENAFHNLDGLTSVKLPDGLHGIKKNAFLNCDNLEKIDLPSSLEYIEERAFSSCGSLKNIVIPDSVNEIEENAFSNCFSLESVTLPKDLECIRAHTFSNCTSLKNINIPKNLKTIDEYAFMRCTELENIDLPNDLKILSEGVFFDCNSLKKVKLPEDVKVGIKLFKNCSSLETIKIPKSLNNIKFGMFEGCKNLKNIDLHDNIEFIDNSAFLYCEKLNLSKLPKNLEYIGDKAFSYCSDLEKLTLPNGVDYIGSEAFYGSGLKEVTLPKNLTKLNDLTFSDCLNLNKVTLNDGLETIGESSFKNCLNLTKVNLPKSVCNIRDNAFSNCQKIKKIVVPNNTSYVGSGAFENCIELEKITLPNSITSIEPYTFNNCRSLKNFELPKYVTKIAEGAFKDTVGITKIDFPNSLAEIGSRAFENSSLSSVNLNEGVIDIGKFAFMNCEQLESVYLPNTIKKIENGVFQKCTTLKQLHLPEYLESIGNYAFSNCIELNSIDLPDGMKTIGNGAFYSCYNLEGLKIPNTVESINSNFIDACEKISNIHIPNNVKELGYFRSKMIYFEKCDDGFDILSKPTENSIPLSQIKLNLPFLSRNWDYKNLLFKEQKNENICNFYNYYMSTKSDEEIKQFLDSHNFTFFKQLPIPNVPEKRYETMNFLHNLGVTSTPIDVGGKKVDYAQKVSGFLLEKQKKSQLIMFNLRDLFLKMENQGFKREFTDFFLKDFDELIEQTKKQPDFLARCYNEFEIVQKTNTNNHGSQRQLKPTVEKFKNYFLDNKFGGVNEGNCEIAKTIAPYFDKQSLFDSAIKINAERINKNIPDNILKKDLKEEDVFANIDSFTDSIEKNQKEIMGNLVKASGNEFTFEWLKKNDPNNFILGKLCSCCAHLDGVGYGIMHASIVDPYVQNLVIRDKNNVIVAKSTLYINPTERYGVFNNVEVNQNITNEEKNEIYKKYILGIRAFAEEYNKEFPEKPLKQINVGMNLNDLSNQLMKNNTESTEILKPMNYSDYGVEGKQYNGDSSIEQYIVWQNENEVKNKKKIDEIENIIDFL